MTIKKKKRNALDFIEDLVKEPLGISNVLLAIREGEGLSQTSFADSLGISKQNLCDIEKGRKNVSPLRAAQFAEILGYPQEVFVTLAIQDELRKSGLKLKVIVSAA